jgi:hypothetical protein
LVRRFFFWVSVDRAVVLFGALGGHRCLKILDRQLQLLGVKAFGLAAELRTPKLLQQMAKPSFCSITRRHSSRAASRSLDS